MLVQRLSAQRKSIGSDALKEANMSERDWADIQAVEVVMRMGNEDHLDDVRAVVAAALRTAHKVPEGCVEAARVLAKIADAYDDNGLDDEARKFWGKNDEHHNTTPPEHIELYDGRGGRCLLTLADCLNARAALAARGEGK